MTSAASTSSAAATTASPTARRSIARKTAGMRRLLRLQQGLEQPLGLRRSVGELLPRGVARQREPLVELRLRHLVHRSAGLAVGLGHLLAGLALQPEEELVGLRGR